MATETDIKRFIGVGTVTSSSSTWPGFGAYLPADGLAAGVVAKDKDGTWRGALLIDNSWTGAGARRALEKIKLDYVSDHDGIRLEGNYKEGDVAVEAQVNGEPVTFVFNKFTVKITNQSSVGTMYWDWSRANGTTIKTVTTDWEWVPQQRT